MTYREDSTSRPTRHGEKGTPGALQIMFTHTRYPSSFNKQSRTWVSTSKNCLCGAVVRIRKAPANKPFHLTAARLRLCIS